MSTFVLVHGAWHGEWCWDKIVPLLQDAGHRVLTFDLPGHGKDKTPPSEVTLKNYTDHLCSILDNESERVILVGHSMGGIVITQTAEYRPEKIQLLVYLCAFLPENEQTLLQILENDKKESPPAVVLSEDKTNLELKDDLIKDAFYGECSESDIFEAKGKLCVQPLLPFITPVRITEDHFEKVPRVYIETLKDNAISVICQREMYTKTPCRQIITLDTDHSPFFSQPEVLSSHLKNLVSE
ncbi:alpha/beta fold hydrolase [Brevibacillus daliensis]|uniref:alpha/beta fold hydrolase n=1 Tax=Brevibacillus daliensis TaxID=2892995 RepID=UPI001E494C12|nr:alpha/beta fold hydrolase [Brevibacillus daliensis]